jgi:hypothetical protein
MKAYDHFSLYRELVHRLKTMPSQECCHLLKREDVKAGATGARFHQDVVVGLLLRLSLTRGRLLRAAGTLTACAGGLTACARPLAASGRSARGRTLRI